jgi:hypothetical protein
MYIRQKNLECIFGAIPVVEVKIYWQKMIPFGVGTEEIQL